GAEETDPADPNNYYNERGPAFNMGCMTRPLNRTVFGPQFSKNSDFSMYRCPGHEGAYQWQINPGNYGADTPTQVESMFKALGNSYQGDFIWFDFRGGPERRAGRFGTFMRPANMISSSGEVILFYESRFAQAFIATAEFGPVFGQTPETVTGSHGKRGEFQVSFADGHESTVRVLKQGTMLNPLNLDINQYPYRDAMARGQDWRYDCFPRPF